MVGGIACWMVLLICSEKFSTQLARTEKAAISRSMAPKRCGGFRSA